MKQAQTDADELIAAYRLEQQDAFDKAASASGEFRAWSSCSIFNRPLARSDFRPSPPSCFPAR